MGGQPDPWWVGRAAFMGQLKNIIREHGWVVQFVGGEPGADRFGYTVGLTEAGLPELYVAGPPSQDCALVLNDLARRSLTVELQPGTGYDIAGEMFEVTPISPEMTRRTLKFAVHLYGRRLGPALQVTRRSTGDWSPHPDPSGVSGALFTANADLDHLRRGLT